MKSLEQIDKNFKKVEITADDIVFYDCLSEPFAVEGLYNPQETNRFIRLPENFEHSDEVCEGVRQLMLHTAGGRVRFVTDSPYVGLIAEINGSNAMQHITGVCQFGFDMYSADVDDRKTSIYTKSFFPPRDLPSEDVEFDGFYQFEERKMREITINFPTYTKVNKVFIGLKEGSILKKADAYTVKDPIVFYGSSVTQGCSASRPGTVYTSHLSRWLDSDYINLGFSGNDRGEPALAEYIKTIKMSAFVYAYGFNTPTLEHYENTHYPFYKIIREKKPNLPIIIMTPPYCTVAKNMSPVEKVSGVRKIAMNTYLKACYEGDENIYFVDGFEALGGIEASDCTIDGLHPTDLGFYNMAKALFPVLRFVIKEKNNKENSNE